MNSFLAYLKKEFMEGIRSYKFLILLIAILFFAIMDPILLKLTPIIIKSQTNMESVEGLVELSQVAAIREHFGNVFQVSTLIIVLTLMGIVAKERSDKTIVITYCNGAKFEGVIPAKLIVYSVSLIVFTLVCFLINYYYSGVLFPNEFHNTMAIIKAGLLYGVYFTFVVSLVIFLSSFFKRPIGAALLTLLTIYTMPIISKFLKIYKYTPVYLTSEALKLNSLPSTDLYTAIIATIGSIIILTLITIEYLNRIEMD